MSETTNAARLHVVLTSFPGGGGRWLRPGDIVDTGSFIHTPFLVQRGYLEAVANVPPEALQKLRARAQAGPEGWEAVGNHRLLDALPPSIYQALAEAANQRAEWEATHQGEPLPKPVLLAIERAEDLRAGWLVEQGRDPQTGDQR